MTQELNTVMTNGVTKYKGCRIEKTREGFQVFGKTVATMDEAKKKIDQAYTNLSDKIR